MIKNKYYIYGFLLLGIIMLFIGCQKKIGSIQDTTEFKKRTPKEQVSVVHLENLQVFLNEDADGIADAFSQNYLDMFRSKDGKKADVSKIYFESWFRTENYKACKKKKIEELVNLGNQKVYSYEEIMKMNQVAVGVKNVVGFEYEEGDILIKFPSRENSPMINGWNGVYRKENGYWKIIAGNF